MDAPTLNERADGYRGLWYQREKLPSEYRYKYSGGLGTYCAKHQPFAIYCPDVAKTFFCYGGVRPGYHRDFELTLDNMDPIEAERAVYHYVSVFDHTTGMVDRPTELLDKRTYDAHDNPVITVDRDGFVWVVSTSHGPLRPAYVHRSVQPYDVTEFQMMEPVQIIDGVTTPITNFSYMQVWYRLQQGFTYFFTVYSEDWNRKTYYASSRDGIEWSSFVQIADIEKGHYQVSAVHSGRAGTDRAGTAFNYHPLPVGLNARTNLYFIETVDNGESWRAADGTSVQLPLTTVKNAALVHDFEADGHLVYMKDMVYDAEGRPLILFITSTGFESGPENDPRIWSLARWTGTRWRIHEITTSDSNYDMGSIYVEPGGVLRLIAPTETGGQPYNPGGEVAMWVSSDDGQTWTRERQVTGGGPYNHTYVRRPVNAHPDFYAFWADGHAREPSPSRLYFCNKAGDLFQLPEQMADDRQAPLKQGSAH